MTQDFIFNELRNQIKQKKIQAKETEIQEALRFAKEQHRTELQANIEYHNCLACMLEQGGDYRVALRHRILAEIYQSTLNRT